MIYDAENTFMWNQDLASDAGGNVVANSGGGDAYEGLFLMAKVDEALDADATVTLTTADSEDMSGADTLLTLALKKEAGSKASVRLPHGLKKYLKAAVTGATTGKVTSALVLDVDVR